MFSKKGAKSSVAPKKYGNITAWYIGEISTCDLIILTHSQHRNKTQNTGAHTPDSFCETKSKLVAITHEYTSNLVRSDLGARFRKAGRKRTGRIPGGCQSLAKRPVKT